MALLPHPVMKEICPVLALVWSPWKPDHCAAEVKNCFKQINGLTDMQLLQTLHLFAQLLTVECTAT